MTFVEFLAWVEKIGAAGTPIFAFMWWSERDERRAAQAELKTIAKDNTVALTAIEKTIDRWSSIFKPRRDPDEH
jgi:sugar phosphate isomerase/epimerase